MYSVKLKMELAILGKIVSMSQSGSHVILEDHDLSRPVAQNNVPSIADEKAVYLYRERRRPPRADTDLVNALTLRGRCVTTT